MEVRASCTGELLAGGSGGSAAKGGEEHAMAVEQE